MDIRYATLADLDAVAAVEAECFPAAEAATKAEFAERIQAYGSHFWLLFESGTLIAFVDGFVTNEPDLTDEMYAQASLHDPHGAWQMIFGVNTLLLQPEEQRLRQLLRLYDGNRAQTARALGISTTTLWRKMKKYGFT